MGQQQTADPVISGKVTSYFLSAPLGGITVLLYVNDSPVAKAFTDESGNFEINTEGVYSRDAEVDPNKTSLHFFNDQGGLIHTVQLDVYGGIYLDLSIKYIPGSDGKDDIQYLHGMLVNMPYVGQLSREDLVDAYHLATGADIAAKNGDLIRKAFPEIDLHRHQFSAERNICCGVGMGGGIAAIFFEKTGEGLASATGIYDYTNDGVVKHFYTENIVVKYVVADGDDDALLVSYRPPAATDLDFILPSGLNVGRIYSSLSSLHPDNTEVAPVFIQKIGILAEYAFHKFTSPPCSFPEPKAPGAARLEYRVLNLGFGIGGQAWSDVDYVVVNRDLGGRYDAVFHEMFHKIQFNIIYKFEPLLSLTPNMIHHLFIEGLAMVFEDVIDDNGNSYFYKADQFFLAPESSLLDLETNPEIRYAAGIFWRYIAEHHSQLIHPADEPAIGVDIYKLLLEMAARTETGRFTFDTVRSALQRVQSWASFDTFQYWNDSLPPDIINRHENIQSYNNLWVNFLIANYMHRYMGPGDADYDERFDYMEGSEPGAGSFAAYQAAIHPANSIRLKLADSAIIRDIAGQKPYAARYFEILPDPLLPARSVTVRYQSRSGMNDPMIAIIRIGPGDTFVDLNISGSVDYTKTINLVGLSRIVIVVGSRASGGDYRLTFDETACPDIMITRTFCAPGKEYEINPRDYSYALPGFRWQNDVMVDNDNNMVPDRIGSGIRPGENNTLKIRLRNKGNVTGNDIRAEAYYKVRDSVGNISGWLPVRDASGSVPVVSGASLVPGEERSFNLNWCMEAAYSGDFKVAVSAPGDSNTDNKICIGFISP